MKRKRRRKKLIVISTVILLCFGFFSWWCNHAIITNARGRIFSDLNEIPFNEVGLVPGTSMFSKKGYVNEYFRYRMEAAAQLYKTGKIKHIIVSGDNHTKGYDEPTDMMNYLMKLGVPQNAITRDYAGFRTFDSMIRTKEIFGVKKFTVISQEFHNQRAIYIADHHGMEVIGFNAENPYRKRKYNLREYFAKVNAVLDIYLFHPSPKFLGEKEPIAGISQY